MIVLARFFDWHEALVIVKPETHRMASHGVPGVLALKSRKLGRPLLPKNLRELVREMAVANPTWGEERLLTSRSEAGYPASRDRRQVP